MNQNIRRKLDRITNTLFAGGVVNPITYIEQISYLIYLKLLDEEENSRELREKLTNSGGNGNSKRLFPGQAERFRWSKWRFKSGDELRNFIRDDVFNYMANSLMREEPKVAEYFKGATLEITDPNVLKEVIDEIDSINFQKLGPDEKGDIYEYLLTYLGKIDSKTLGTFRTPRQIREMMVQILDPDFGDTIFDPACGTGGFLIDSLEYILSKYSNEKEELPIYGEEWLIQKYLQKYPEEKSKFDNENNENGEDAEVPKTFIQELKKENPNLQTYAKGHGEMIPNWDLLEASLYGFDVSRNIMRIASMNMVLHSVPKSNIKRVNTLSSMGGLTDEDIRRKYKVILSNPPFAGVLPQESIREDLPTNSKKSELLFLSVMMESLAKGGRCAVVVPEGLLFGSTTAHKEIRRKLLNDFEVQAIISLPAGVFKPYAGVKTSIIVFRKPLNEKTDESENATKKVWFYEIKNDGFDPDKVSGGGRTETPERNDIPQLINEWREYKNSGFKNIPGIETGSILSYEDEESKNWWASYEKIAENDFNLSANRYKPQMGQKPPEENPVDLIKDVLNLESEIKDGLEKLLINFEELE